MQRGRMIITLSSVWLLKELSCSSSKWQLWPSLAFASTSHLHQPPQFASRMRVSELLHHRVFYGLCFLRSFGLHRGICESIHSFSIALAIRIWYKMSASCKWCCHTSSKMLRIPERFRHGILGMTSCNVCIFLPNWQVSISWYLAFLNIYIYIQILLIFIFLYIVKCMCIYI